jgi:hypothetical protein
VWGERRESPGLGQSRDMGIFDSYSSRSGEIFLTEIYTFSKQKTAKTLVNRYYLCIAKFGMIQLKSLKTLSMFSKIIGHLHYTIPQNTTQKSISFVFCLSAIRHDSSLSKYRKHKQSPPWTCAILSISRGGLLLFTVLAEWRIMTNRAYAKNKGDGLLCSILWLYWKCCTRKTTA